MSDNKKTIQISADLYQKIEKLFLENKAYLSQRLELKNTENFEDFIEQLMHDAYLGLQVVCDSEKGVYGNDNTKLIQDLLGSVDWDKFQSIFNNFKTKEEDKKEKVSKPDDSQKIKN